MKHQIFGKNLTNIPWQPPQDDSPVWRYADNPIIKRNPVKGVARIFNSAVVPFGDGFAGVFRGEKINGIPKLYTGKSDDGIHWSISDEEICFLDENGKPFENFYSYDPRVIPIDDKFYVVWCADFYGPTLAIAETKDFKHFERYSHPYLPFNRNGVLFPRKINGKYYMLSRPSDGGHTSFGDIFISESPDLKYWGNHKHVMSHSDIWWQSLKIGAGAVPIETDVGWLIFYHGVVNTCNGYVYSMGGAILDIDQPDKVLYRSENYFLTPEEEYEERGFVPNVVFPCAALSDAKTGRIAIYYGAADSYVALAFTDVDRIVEYIMQHNRLR